MVPNFDAFDANHDGQISREEFNSFGRQQNPNVPRFTGLPYSGPAAAPSSCVGLANAFAACQRQSSTPLSPSNLTPTNYNSSPQGQAFSPRSFTPGQLGACNRQFDFDPAPKVLAFRQFVTQLMGQASETLSQDFQREFSEIRSEVQSGQAALAQSNDMLVSKDSELEALRMELARYQDLLAQKDQEISVFRSEVSKRDQELAHVRAEVARAQGIINRFEQKEQVLANMVQAATPALESVQNVFKHESNFAYSGPPAASAGYQATRPGQMFDMLDSNHDGKISRAEFDRFTIPATTPAVNNAGTRAVSFAQPQVAVTGAAPWIDANTRLDQMLAERQAFAAEKVPLVPQVQCHNCGNFFMPDANFCRLCGTPRSAEAPANQMSMR
eukprot:TRINITY_DN62453_c0_g1_i1.p1 TRINITY_DN62453_c0_g1~~TRINITY_DN62453_c0_g1_i1.p1  ORF type:complete len:393 (+),score=60.05 TRINITY_DN62453_c0_g1_i1:27-1181(+)